MSDSVHKASDSIAAPLHAIEKFVLLTLPVLILVLAYPFLFEKANAALAFWAQGDLEYKAFLRNSAASDTLVGIELICVVIMGFLAPTALLLRAVEPALTGKEQPSWSRILFRISALNLLLFSACYLILQMFFASVGLIVGQEAMAIHSGSAFCIVSLFVIYRYFEAIHHGADADEKLFSLQLAVLALSPWLYQVAYGLWVSLVSSTLDGNFAEQLTVSFGHFLLPLLVLYVYDSLHRSDSQHRNSPKQPGFGISIFIIIAIAALFIGTSGYEASSIQAAII